MLKAVNCGICPNGDPLQKVASLFFFGAEKGSKALIPCLPRPGGGGGRVTTTPQIPPGTSYPQAATPGAPHAPRSDSRAVPSCVLVPSPHPPLPPSSPINASTANFHPSFGVPGSRSQAGSSSSFSCQLGNRQRAREGLARARAGLAATGLRDLPALLALSSLSGRCHSAAGMAQERRRSHARCQTWRGLPKTGAGHGVERCHPGLGRTDRRTRRCAHVRCAPGVRRAPGVTHT